MVQQGLTADPNKSDTYTAFKARYRGDLEGFVLDCFTWKPGHGPATYQRDILREFPTRRRASVRGPHGLGKTAMAAWIILWFALTRDGDDWKIPTTASAWRQLTKFLWPEVHKWARRLKWDLIGRQPFNTRTELQGMSLKLSTGEAFAVASNDPMLIEGAHADSLLYLFDESKAIPGETFDAAEGAFSNAGDDTPAEAYAMSISTPGEPQGRFYDIQRRAPGYEDWWVRAVTLEETISAGRVSRQWAEQRARQWGEASAVYQNRVAGQFCASDEDGLIPLSWVEAANERWHAWVEAGRPGAFSRVGVDVGLEGDKTVFALRYGDAFDALRYQPKGDTMVTAGKVKGILDAHSGTAVVDVIGIGAGVVHRLREQEIRVVAFHASESTDLRDSSGELGFINKRAAAWWQLRESLDPSQGATLALPPDDILTGDLTAPHWKETSGAKIQVETKKDVKKRLKRSTDAADAVVMAWFFEPETKKQAPAVAPPAMVKHSTWNGR